MRVSMPGSGPGMGRPREAAGRVAGQATSRGTPAGTHNTPPTGHMPEFCWEIFQENHLCKNTQKCCTRTAAPWAEGVEHLSTKIWSGKQSLHINVKELPAATNAMHRRHSNPVGCRRAACQCLGGLSAHGSWRSTYRTLCGTPLHTAKGCSQPRKLASCKSFRFTDLPQRLLHPAPILDATAPHGGRTSFFRNPISKNGRS